MTATATPRNLAMMNIGRCTGLLKTVMMVLFSNSLATAPEAEKIAMNKLVRNSVDRPNSRKSLLSSLIVYMARDGLMKSNSRAAAIIIEYIGCLSVSMKVFLAIVNNLFISHYRPIAPALVGEWPHLSSKRVSFFFVIVPILDYLQLL